MNDEKTLLIKRFETALDLKRVVVGVKFLLIKEEYEDSPAEMLDDRMTYCRMVYNAMRGKHFKATLENFTCAGGPEMLGLRPIINYERSGKQYDNFRLYEDMAIAHMAQANLLPIEQSAYGIEIGPLSEMNRADVVIVVCDGFQAMRIMQGYTYHYGTALNIGTIGNQGACSDMTSRPYMTNDLNLSMLCAGARQSMNTTDGEIGLGIPTAKFWMVADGVLKTLNAALNDNRKKAVQKSIDERGVGLGFEIEYGAMYANYPEKYTAELYG